MKSIKQSHKLAHVTYDIRGPVMARAQEMEKAGQSIIKLNIGNPAPFGFTAPPTLIKGITDNLVNASGYSDSRGLFTAREAIAKRAIDKGIKEVSIEDIYIGNGVSELIMMTMQALLDPQDEVLIPMPDYPLWTASVHLAGGSPVHYLCDENKDWQPDIEDIKQKITSKTKAMVLINPNNPTGALYPKPILEKMIAIAREHELIIFSDEVYDHIVYDEATHIATASLADDLCFLTFGGLSKNHCAAGFRAGWVIISGHKKIAEDYIQGLSILSSMRLGANVPAQYAIPAALDDYQYIQSLVAPNGLLTQQRNIAVEGLNAIKGVSCVQPKGALYVFPRLDASIYPIRDDQTFAFNLLEKEQVLITQGTGFKWLAPDHFRIVFLPREETLREAIARIARFLAQYH